MTSATGGAQPVRPPAPNASTSIGPPCNCRPASSTTSSPTSWHTSSETNHTPEFWSTVARLMPGFENHKTTLAAIGKTIWLGSIKVNDER